MSGSSDTLGYKGFDSNDRTDDFIDCFMCGVCCIVLDISSLGKPSMIRCEYLQEDNSCGIYHDRPDVCKEYRADSLCNSIKNLPHDQQIKKFRDIFDI